MDVFVSFPSLLLPYDNGSRHLLCIIDFFFLSINLQSLAFGHACSALMFASIMCTAAAMQMTFLPIKSGRILEILDAFVYAEGFFRELKAREGDFNKAENTFAHPGVVQLLLQHLEKQNTERGEKKKPLRGSWMLQRAGSCSPLHLPSTGG